MAQNRFERHPRLTLSVMLLCSLGMTLLVAEIISRKVNLANGTDIPLLKIQALGSKKASRRQIISVIDPHLGYARRKTLSRGELQDKPAFPG